MRFDGRVALVTGAGRGLGRAHAEFLAARGASVVVNNRVHADRPSAAEAVAAAIRAAGGNAVADGHAVEDPAAARAMVDAAYERFGRLDIIVNNAAVWQERTPFEAMPLEVHRANMEINYWGAVYALHAALPRMKEAGYGRVVFTTSTAGLFGQVGMTSYAATKAAVLGLMRCLALENAGADFRFNAVSPFAVTNDKVEKLVPPHLRPMMTPEKVSPRVGWLCSEQCTQNAMIFFAGGGRYRRDVMAEGPRVDFDGDDLSTVMGQIESTATLEPRKHSGVAGIKLIPELAAKQSNTG
jgi:NAD(P)-dependent dehydrogenase (short-subunit alcohol dehydrogenase family)